jgi:hypothetical protein
MERLAIAALGMITTAGFGFLLVKSVMDLGPNPFALVLFGVPTAIGGAMIISAYRLS